jgi:hypothetical protein
MVAFCRLSFSSQSKTSNFGDSIKSKMIGKELDSALSTCLKTKHLIHITSVAQSRSFPIIFDFTEFPKLLVLFIPLHIGDIAKVEKVRAKALTEKPPLNRQRETSPHPWHKTVLPAVQAQYAELFLFSEEGLRHNCLINKRY